METTNQTITIDLTAQKISSRFRDFGIDWVKAYVDMNYCFLRPTFCYKSNIIAN